MPRPNKTEKIKSDLHPRNRHRSQYQFKELIQSNPELKQFVLRNKYGNETIDFADPLAVKNLNKALLLHFYALDYWDIPDGYLCPPVPGRADYIHKVADLLAKNNHGEIPKGKNISCLDIGVGANCIYPIIGFHEYGWSFIGSDIDPLAIKSATSICILNQALKKSIKIEQQKKPKNIFKGILKGDDRIDLSICNPPFHSSAKEAHSTSARKVGNLTGRKTPKVQLNFGGKSNELWCPGGEQQFIRSMIEEGRMYKDTIYWFTTLLSKSSNLKPALNFLENQKATRIKILPMSHGNKISRILAWTFLTRAEEDNWKKERWNKKTAG